MFHNAYSLEIIGPLCITIMDTRFPLVDTIKAGQNYRTMSNALEAQCAHIW